MEITQSLHDDAMEMRLVGRLDAEWSDHVAAAISQTIRGGHHRLVLDMAGVDFLSSAGIRVLIKFHKQLHEIGGRLSVIRPSRFVAEVLGGMGLGALVAPEDIASAQRATVVLPYGQRVETEQGLFKVERSEPGEGLTCRVLADPGDLSGSAVEEYRGGWLDCRAGRFSLGIGGPGETLASCRGQIGEFLAVGGAAAFLPAGATQTPDYLLARGSFVPRLQVFSGLECAGELSRTMSFQAMPDHRVSLSDLAEQCLATAECDAAGIVMAAEVDGLVGAWLRRSPAERGGLAAALAFPQIRDWMRFTAERAFTSEVALVVGVAARGGRPQLASQLRPLARDGSLSGHFHAAAFTYHPLRKKSTGLDEAVRELFEWQTLRGLLHLIHDTRPAEGIGQSEFVRGTCWVGPIARVEEWNGTQATKGK